MGSVLASFSPEVELVKSSVRNCLVTYFAISIALATNETADYLTSWLIQLFTLNLVMAPLFQLPFILRAGHLVLYWVASCLGFLVWVAFTTLLLARRSVTVAFKATAPESPSASACQFRVGYFYFYLIAGAGWILETIAALWLIGLLVSRRRAFSNIRLRVRPILGTIFIIGLVEVIIANTSLVEKDGTLVPVPQPEWGFGQTIALVMVAGQVLEIARFHLSRHQKTVDKYFCWLKSWILGGLPCRWREGTVPLVPVSNQGEGDVATHPNQEEDIEASGNGMERTEVCERRSTKDVRGAVIPNIYANVVDVGEGTGSTKFVSGFRHQTW